MEDNIFKQQIKRDWQDGAYAVYYYEAAERAAWLQVFWAENSSFRQVFNQLDLSSVIELACGHGRHADFITKNMPYGTIVLVDVNGSNIAFCAERFKEFPNITALINDGSSLRAMENNSATSLFCYDAMVHFEYDDVASYLQEISRVLVSGGKALLHHSNNDRRPGLPYTDQPHGRNFMSMNLFSHMAQRARLRVVEQRVLDWPAWGDDIVKELDGLTLVEKP